MPNNVSVKPLEWNPFTAYTPFGYHYSVWERDNGVWECNLLDGQFKTLEATRAAAQADYETRILSALISSPGKDGGQEVEELRREIASLEYRLDEANGHLRRLEKSPATAWGEVRRGSDGNLAIFSTKFNTVKARFTSGNELKPGEKVYVGTQPASTALVVRLTKALEPFSFIAGELFANNYNDSDIVFSVQTKTEMGSTVKLDVAFSTFREARNALSASQSTSREGER